MTGKRRIVLGIETSCDETAAALVDEEKTILAHAMISQKEHGLWGGVVPEIAARAHLHTLDRLIARVMEESSLRPADLDGIAATAGPGLVGGLLIGLTMGKAMALAANVPFIAVHHLSAHALSARIEHACEFPYLLLLASGGHCLLAIVFSPHSFRILGQCLDDAPGETFDKTARILGQGYPGGAIIEKLARDGDPNHFTLPRPLAGRNHCDFSFSGLKSAVRRLVERRSESDLADDVFTRHIAASLQQAIGDIFLDRLHQAIRQCHDLAVPIQRLVFAGGVAANHNLRRRLKDWAKREHLRLILPSPSLCTDNAIMIAWAGIECANGEKRTKDWSIGARSRWPLPQEPQEPLGTQGTGTGTQETPSTPNR